jgi:putative oxidoreductase
MNVLVSGDVYGARIRDWWFGPLMLAARLALAFEFMLFGIRKYLHPDNIASLMSAHGIPGELIWLVIPFQICFGWLVALGLQTRISSLALFGFCVIAPSIFHTHSLDNWSRDIASAGGWIFIAIFGPGPWSLDAIVKLPGQSIFGTLHDSDRWMHTALAAARLLMSAYFLACGIRDAAFSGPTVDYLSAHGATSIVPLTAGLQIVGGFMVLLGWHVRPASAMLLVYSLALAFTAHSPATDLGLHQPDFSFTMLIDGLFQASGGGIASSCKDLAVSGAMLALLANGPGLMSLRAKSEERHKLGVAV